MHTEWVLSYPEANRTLDDGADIAILMAKDTIGTYSHVMTRDEKLASAIQNDLGWQEVNRENGHICMFVQDLSVSDVRKKLKEVYPEK